MAARPRMAARPCDRLEAPHRHGCRLVSDGLLPGRAQTSSGGRSTTWPTNSSARRRSGWGRPASEPGIIGEIGTDKPWVSPAEERVHRAAARASRRTGLADHDPLGHVAGRAWPSSGSSRRRAPIPARVVIGHADSYPNLDHYLEIIRRGANLEFDFLGMSFSAVERHGEGRVVDLLLDSSRAVTRIGSCSARTSATTPSSSGTRATATSISTSRSCPAFATPGCPRRRNRADQTCSQPASAPLDRTPPA